MKNTLLIQPGSSSSRFSPFVQLTVLHLESINSLLIKLVFEKELELIYISVLQETKELVAIKKFKDSEGKRLLLPNACFFIHAVLLVGDFEMNYNTVVVTMTQIIIHIINHRFQDSVWIVIQYIHFTQGLKY